MVKRLLLTLLISIFLLGGCGNKDVFSWESPVKEDGIWRVSATAKLVVVDKKQQLSLTYTPKIENISGKALNNISIEVLLPESIDWPESTGFSAINRSGKIEAGKVGEFPLTAFYNIDKIIKKEQINSIKIKIQWDDANQESGQSTAIISF